MRIILCGGGTAGHVSPAIAIAEELREETPKSEILFIGRTDGGENRAVVNAGIKLETLAIKGIKRSVSIENVKRMKIAIEARKKAKEIIAENPNISHRKFAEQFDGIGRKQLIAQLTDMGIWPPSSGSKTG